MLQQLTFIVTILSLVSAYQSSTDREFGWRNFFATNGNFVPSYETRTDATILSTPPLEHASVTLTSTVVSVPVLETETMWRKLQTTTELIFPRVYDYQTVSYNRNTYISA